MAKSNPSAKKELRALRLFHSVRMVNEAVASAILPVLMKANISQSQFLIIETLAHNGPLNQKELGNLIGKSEGNITLVVKNLLKAGFVRQEVSPSDKRQKIISLTSEGHQKFMTIYPEFFGVIYQFFSGIPSKEQKNMIRIWEELHLSQAQVPHLREEADLNSEI